MQVTHGPSRKPSQADVTAHPSSARSGTNTRREKFEVPVDVEKHGGGQHTNHFPSTTGIPCFALSHQIPRCRNLNATWTDETVSQNTFRMVLSTKTRTPVGTDSCRAVLRGLKIFFANGEKGGGSSFVLKTNIFFNHERIP